MDDPSPEPMPDAERGGGRPSTPPPSTRAASMVDWLFRDRQTGRITIAQFPNVPLWIFLATVVSRLVVPTGSTERSVVDWVGVGALAWWALDEVLRGVNPWRRLLGLGGCAIVIADLVSMLR